MTADRLHWMEALSRLSAANDGGSYNAPSQSAALRANGPQDWPLTEGATSK